MATNPPEQAPEKIKTVVTARDSAPQDGAELHAQQTTPGGEHVHVVVQAMTPFTQALVRFARTYIQGLVGFLLLLLAGAPVATGLGVQVHPGEFWDTFRSAAGLALAPAIISLLQNFAELLARLDETFPRARA